MEKVMNGRGDLERKGKILTGMILLMGLFNEFMNFAYIPLVEYLEQRLAAQGKTAALQLIPLCLIFIAGIVLSQYIREIFLLRLRKWVGSRGKKKCIRILDEKRVDALEEYGEGNYLLAFQKADTSAEAVSIMISIVLSGFMLLFAGSYIILRMNWRYLLVMLLLVMLLFVSGVLSKPLEKKRARINEKEKNSISLMNSMIKSIYIIKNYYMEEKMDRIFGKNAETIAKLQMKERDYGVFLEMYMQVIRCSVMVLVPTLTAWLTLNGAVQEGIVITSSYALFYILGHLTSMMENLGNLSRVKGDLQILKEGQSLPEKKSGGVLKPLKGDISFRNIAAEYQGKTVFCNHSITLVRGRVTLLMGESGCGKSTMLKCMAGLKLFSEGEIFLGDEKVGQEVFMNYAAYAPQEPVILPITPYENIKLAGAEISDAQIDRVIGEICPDVIPIFKTCENARLLSGGQKQLTGVVRALLTGAPVILLDEPTSAMDVKTVKGMIQYLRKNPESQTILLTSHDAGVQEQNFDVYHL